MKANISVTELKDDWMLTIQSENKMVYTSIGISEPQAKEIIKVHNLKQNNTTIFDAYKIKIYR